jgi:hypothetical protein
MSIVIYRTSTDASAEKLFDWITTHSLDIQCFNIDLHTDSSDMVVKHEVDATATTLVNIGTGHKYAVGVDAILALTDEQIAQIKVDLVTPLAVKPASTLNPA